MSPVTEEPVRQVWMEMAMCTRIGGSKARTQRLGKQETAARPKSGVEFRGRSRIAGGRLSSSRR